VAGWLLVTGGWSLVSGDWFLIAGSWWLASGGWFLVTGFWSLAHESWGFFPIRISQASILPIILSKYLIMPTNSLSRVSIFSQVPSNQQLLAEPSFFQPTTSLKRISIFSPATRNQQPVTVYSILILQTDYLFVKILHLFPAASNQ